MDKTNKSDDLWERFLSLSIFAAVGSVLLFGAGIIPLSAIFFGVLSNILKPANEENTYIFIIIGIFFLFAHITLQEGFYWFGN